jgi:L-aspartate oxidase
MEKTAKETKQEVPNVTRGTEVHQILSQRQVSKAVPASSFATLQQLHWDKVGAIRDRESLIQAADTLAAWQESLPPPTDRPSHELHNLVLTGRLITEAALLREESRGAHFRSDFPQSSPQWQRHIVFTRNDLRG